MESFCTIVPRRGEGAWGLALGGLMASMIACGQAKAVTPTTYSGRAMVVRSNVVGQTVNLVDTGPLPPSGGLRDATLVEAEVENLLFGRVLHAVTAGSGNRSHSQAAIAELQLTVAGHRVYSDFLMTRTSAECRDGTVILRAGADVFTLIIDDQFIPVTGEPNQTVTVGNLTVVINERFGSTSGTSGEVTAHALHLTVAGLADVVICSSESDINCGGVHTVNDFVTGGGFITGTPLGERGNFGVAGGIRNGAFWGHLTYIDHATGMKVKSTGITGYEVVDATTRLIEGGAEIDGQGGFTFQVIVSDNGEPGTMDTFAIDLSNGYSAAGPLEGGNIQLHSASGNGSSGSGSSSPE